MKIFASGLNVTVTLQLSDTDGNSITPQSASYSVFDETGSEVITSTPITITGAETELAVVVPSGDNTLLIGERHGARTVLVQVVSAEGVHRLMDTYVLESYLPLAVPSESALTLQQAMILSMQVDQNILDDWNYADDQARTGALQEAWARMSRLRLRPYRHTDIELETAAGDMIEGLFAINQITLDTWNALPAHFRTAVKRAQLVEAAVALGGDPTWDRRVDGLLSKTVGESSEMFRSRKPIEDPLSPKAMRELRPYIRTQISVSR